MLEKLVIIGCGGHARSVADVVLFNNPDTDILFFDENAKPMEKIMGFDVVSYLPDSFKNAKFHCAIGNNEKRKSANGVFINIVSKDSYISNTCILAGGDYIAHCAHLGPLSKIGKGVIINTQAIIEHEVTVGDFSHISVNTTICGRCKIGSNVFVGAASVVKDGISICNDVIIGCGSVVIKDIIEKGTYVGNPVRRIK